MIYYADGRPVYDGLSDHRVERVRAVSEDPQGLKRPTGLAPTVDEAYRSGTIEAHEGFDWYYGPRGFYDTEGRFVWVLPLKEKEGDEA